MKKPSPNQSKPAEQPDLPESSESPETVSERTKPPGAAGLANEARPGLGTRASEPAPESPKPVRTVDKSGKESAPRITRNSYEEPRPDPREQPSDSLEHDEERSTGVSGHSGNT
jgi:hypothetical protein